MAFFGLWKFVFSSIFGHKMAALFTFWSLVQTANYGVPLGTILGRRQKFTNKAKFTKEKIISEPKVAKTDTDSKQTHYESDEIFLWIISFQKTSLDIAESKTKVKQIDY